VSLLLSWGAHIAIEKPGIAFGRRLQVVTRRRKLVAPHPEEAAQRPSRRM
jgi:hypothetical protein